MKKNIYRYLDAQIPPYKISLSIYVLTLLEEGKFGGSTSIAKFLLIY
jgi:hypothetical protein